MPFKPSRYRLHYSIFVRTRGKVARSDENRTRALIVFALSVLICGGLGTVARAQLPDSLSSDTRISLLTIYPGDAIYAAFGHSTYRFHDPTNGYDIVFNYGTFDSTDPYFIPRFIYGKLNYVLSVGSMEGLMRGAAIERRSVVEQKLRLSPEQIQNLYRTLKINARPENRTYRYDFLFENCATILLDRIRAVDGARIRLDSTAAPRETFRELLQPYLNHRVFYDLGIAMVLGSTLDKPSTYEERSFLPLELMNAFEKAVVLVPQAGDEPARSAPLVSRTDTLSWVAGASFAEHQDLTLLWIFALIALLWIGLDLRRFYINNHGFAAPFHNRGAFPPIGIAARFLFGVAGAAGLILAFVWFVSAHTVGIANWNMLWVLPTHILPAVFWSRIPAVWRRWYFRASALAAFALLALQPLLSQKLHPALFPIVFLIVWRSVALGLRESSSGPTEERTTESQTADDHMVT